MKKIVHHLATLCGAALLLAPIVAHACGVIDLSITKVARESSVSQGGQITYDFVIKQNAGGGGNIATSITVIDTIPLGLKYVSSSSNDGVTCSPSSLDPFKKVTCSVQGQMPGGAEKEFSMTFNVTDATPCKDIKNRVEVRATEVDSKSSNNTAVEETPITNCTDPQNPDIKVTKSGPSHVYIEDQITYTIRVENTGQGTALDLRVLDEFEQGLTYVFGNCSHNGNGNLLVCPVGDLAPGAHKDFSVTFRFNKSAVSCGEKAENTATSQSVNRKDDSDSAKTEVVCEKPDIEVIKSVVVGDPSVEAGDRLRYGVHVKNLSDAPISRIHLWDTVPDGLTFNDANSDPSCEMLWTSNQVRCFEQEIAGNRGYRFTVEFTVNDNVKGTHPLCEIGIKNTADAEADNIPRKTSNQTITPVDCPQPRIEIEKELLSDSTASAGDSIEYDIIIRSVGDSDATNIELSDLLPLPSAMVFDEARSDSRCQFTNAVFCTIGTVEKGDTEKVRLVFTLLSNAPCSGSFINTVRANTINQVGLQATSEPVTLRCDDPILKATKVEDKSSVTLGERLTYTILLENTGTGDATNIELRDTVPAGLIFDVGRSTSGCTAFGSEIRCVSFNLDAGDDKEFRLVFNVDQ